MLESLESALRTSQGHPEDVPDDPNLAAVTYCEEDNCVIISRRDCQETASTTTQNKVRTTESQNTA